MKACDGERRCSEQIHGQEKISDASVDPFSDGLAQKFGEYYGRRKNYWLAGTVVRSSRPRGLRAGGRWRCREGVVGH